MAHRRPITLLQVYIALLMPRGSDNQANNNWRRLWEVNIKSRLQAVRAWHQRLSNSPTTPGTMSFTPFTFDSLEEVAMSTNLMVQSPEDQFLHWCQDMERKKE